jgi:hypothetical protein
MLTGSVADTTAGDGKIGDPLSRHDIDDGDRAGADKGGIAHVRDEQSCAARTEREAVRPNADTDLFDGAVMRRPVGGRRREDPHGVLTPVRGEDEIELVADEGTGHGRQSRHGADVRAPLRIDDVDGVVGGVGDVDQPGGCVHGGVIEAAGAQVRGKIDEAQELE